MEGVEQTEVAVEETAGEGGEGNEVEEVEVRASGVELQPTQQSIHSLASRSVVEGSLSVRQEQLVKPDYLFKKKNPRQLQKKH